jgi:signal transduction histidine kinase
LDRVGKMPILRDYKQTRAINMKTNIDVMTFKLDSTVQDLQLWDKSLELNSVANHLTQYFENEPLMPGILLTRNQHYAGMISRQKFFEFMSRPYSLGLFGERPIANLYDFVQPEMFILPASTTIINATQLVLQRSFQLVYEPIVVKGEQGLHQLLDVQQLLLAHSKIQILTLTQLQQAQAQSQSAETDLRETEQKYLDLLEKEKEIVRENLVECLSNEINNPTKLVIGNLVHTNRYIQELLRLVSLYREYYPQPVEEIQVFIEKTPLDSIIAELPKLLNSIKDNAKRIQTSVRSLNEDSKSEVPALQQ